MFCSVYGLKKDYLCKQYKMVDNEVFQEDIFLSLKDDFNCPLDAMEEICDKQLYDAIVSLTSRQKSILFMIVVDGYSEIEVASELNISQQRVNKVKNKALAVLRKNLER